jgi:hypothetical protein
MGALSHVFFVMLSAAPNESHGGGNEREESGGEAQRGLQAARC